MSNDKHVAEPEVVEAKIVESAPVAVKEGEEPAGGEVETPSAPAKSRVKFPGWSDLLMVMGVFLLSAIVGSLLLLVLMKGDMTGEIPAKYTCITYLIQMLPVVLFIALRRRSFGLDNKLHLAPRKVNPPLVLWGFLLVMISGVVLEPLFEAMPDANLELLEHMIGSGGWALFTTSVCAPIIEEIIFRGQILVSVRERFGAFVAVVISAVLFALAHFSVPQQLINAFIVGLILGFIYVRTGSLLAVILIHAINNAMAFIGMEFFGGSGDMTLREAISSNLWYWVVYGFCVVIFILSMMQVYRTLRADEVVDGE